MRTISLTELPQQVGAELGFSEWLTVDQARIDTFADATGDHQWIHVDPARAVHGPFGSTVAHGYLTLSILARLVPDLFTVDGVAFAVNYGLNKVRFPAPVPSGSRIRATATVAEVETIGSAVQLTLAATVEVENGTKPACVAESVIRLFPAGAGK